MSLKILNPYEIIITVPNIDIIDAKLEVGSKFVAKNRVEVGKILDAELIDSVEQPNHIRYRIDDRRYV